MKNILTIIFVISLISHSCNHSNTHEQVNETAIYNITFPVKGIKLSDSDIKARTIIIDPTKKVHTIYFGTDSITESTIEIYSTNLKNKPVITQHFNPNEKRIIDISKLNKGAYKVKAIAIEEACTFSIEIK